MQGQIKVADKWQIGSLFCVGKPARNKGTGNQNECRRSLPNFCGVTSAHLKIRRRHDHEGHVRRRDNHADSRGRHTIIARRPSQAASLLFGSVTSEELRRRLRG